MFPIGDDNTGRQMHPVVTPILIGINVLVFLLELAQGEQFIMNWAFIPARFAADPAGNMITVLTAMFMHGGWLHLFGNMLFLWIFGDNVEDRIGRARYLIFYLLAGVAGTLAQFALMPGSTVPNVGASGAIAGVLGAYILMFPQAAGRRAARAARSSPCRRSSSSAPGLPFRSSAASAVSPRWTRTPAASPIWRISAASPRAS